MKFLCDQCKAKYQIADEKVAGRTVRMKCRKCGHMIEVRAEVTESSVSRFPPAPDEPSSAPRAGLATSFSAARPSRASHAPSALAGAFQRKVQNDDDDNTVMAPAASFEPSVTEEWYAAINGVPVGPIRLSELRTKVSAGAINDETLVWQEGFEEWRPVKTITQLAAIVREAAAPKPLTGGQPASPTPAPPRAALKPSPVAARQTAPLGPVPAAVASRSNVVPISRGGGGAAAVALAPMAPAAMPSSSPMPAVASAVALQPTAAPSANPFAGIDPFAAPAPMAVADPFAAPAVSVSPVSPVADPFAFPPAQAPVEAPRFAPVAATLASSDSLAPPPQQQKKGPPLFFVAVLVLATAFGITAAVLTFKTDKPVATNGTTAQPSSAVPAVTAPPSAAPTETAVATNDVDAAAPVAQKVAMGGTGPKATAAAPASSSPAKVDLSALLTGSNTGKTAGPGGGTAGPGSGTGQALDAASIQRTVANYKAPVKRKCWDNGGDNKPSANVSVSVTVAADGHVSSASASGDDPAVAKCVENHVRGWKFDGGGQAVIPFHFVRQ